LRDAGAKSNVSGQVDCIGTRLEGVTKDDVIDIFCRNSSSFHRRASREYTEISSREIFQGTAKFSKGCAHAGQDYDGVFFCASHNQK
jgi:hypothetical protein